MKPAALACALIGAAAFAVAHAAPDEQKLGKGLGYPVGNAGNWFFDESLRVGSFTHQAEIPGLYRAGPAHVLRPAAQSKVMPLPAAQHEPDYRWNIDQTRGLSVDDFLARQRIMGLLIVKDGVIQVERYQYDRKPTDRFTSQSMAKSITALAVGFALAEGRIASLDDRAEQYAPRLLGTLYGETTIRSLLHMASGARFTQTYDGAGDSKRFSDAIVRNGIELAVCGITQRESEQGTTFNYANPNTATLAAVVHGATGTSLSAYLTPRLWQPIGAEASALWSVDRTGLELGFGTFNATLRDYARLGVVLANDGIRPDDPAQPQIVPRDFLLEATDWKRGPEAFRPGRATPSYGYGYQFWLYPGQQRRFIMLGVYGQSMFVDPALKLVIVQTGANATAEAGNTSLGRERDAFWRGVLRYYRPK